MAIKCLVYFVAMLSLLVNYRATGRRLTKENLDLETEFNHLKKPSVKTIKTESEDIYDCVDFYKQPAFDHPLLKNHTFHPQMRPSVTFDNIPTHSQEKDVLTTMKSKKRGCPSGTVPIRRISKDDFIKMKRFTEEFASRTKFNTLHPIPGNHFAIVQTKSDPSMKVYNGAKGVFNVYNVPVRSSQYSSGEVIIKNGDDSIRAGWTVNPTINKDNRTRYFQYFEAGQSHCFNTLCPGFVNVNKFRPIDAEMKHVSKRGGLRWVIAIHIYKDPKDGNWWLALGDQKTIQGFWPRQIFGGLATSGSYVAVGGEAYGPLDQPLPPMGNGYYPIANPSLSAYCHNFTILDEHYKPNDDPQDTETYSDNWHYGVSDVGKDRDWGRMIYYGGTTLQI